MANERDIGIRVTAENLPANAFAASSTSVEGFRANVENATKSTKKFSTDSVSGFDAMIPSVASVGGAIAGAFSVGAVVSFVKGVVDSAGHIADLSAKLGISTDAVQRYEYATKLSGGTIEDVSKAILAMSNRLASGDQSLVSALQGTTLTIAKLKAQEPEQAFLSIVQAIANTKSPMDQVRMAMDAFGKSGVELLPAIRNGFLDAANSASIMAEETISAWDDAGDAMGAFWQSLSTMTGNVLGLPVRAFRTLKTEAQEWAAAMQGKVLNSVREVVDGVPPLTQAVGLAARSVDDLGEAQKELEAEQKKAAAATEAYRSKVNDLVSTMTGRKVKDEVRLIADAVKQAGKEGGITADQYDKLGKRLSALRDEGAKLQPELKDIADDFDRQRDLTAKLTTSTTDFVRQFQDVGPSLETARRKAQELHPSLDELRGKFNDLIVPIGETGQLLTDLNGRKITLEPPPLTPWEEFRGRVNDVYRGIVDDAAGSLVDMLTGATGFKDGFLEIWGSIKSGVRDILSDMLGDVLHRFIGGILNELSGGSFENAFVGWLGRGTAAASGAGAGGAGGAAGGAAGGGGALSQFFAGVAPYIAGALLPFLIGNLISPGPVVTPPKSNLETAQELFDYLGPNGDAFLQYMNEHPELWGQGNGFRTGTADLDYQTFSPTGTPAMLHNREAVIPQGGGHQLAGEIAAALGPYLSGSGRGGGAMTLTIPINIGTRELRTEVIEIVNLAGSNGQVQISARQVTARNPRG